MPATRRTVLELLAAASDATRRETTTVDALAAALGADEQAVESHLRGLEDCDLARIESDGSARVTITGEELLEIDADEVIIVDPDAATSEM
jgi:DNA-binding transcriptional ArsR family regulator